MALSTGQIVLILFFLAILITLLILAHQGYFDQRYKLTYQNTITITSDAQGETTTAPDGYLAQTFPANSIITLTGTPPKDSQVASWEVNGVSVPNPGPSTKVTLTQDTVVKVTYAQLVSVSLTQPEGGTVTANGSITSPQNVVKNTFVTFRADANDNYLFDKWVGISGDGPSVQIQVTADISVSAVFKKSLNITLNDPLNGIISFSPTGTVDGNVHFYATGTPVTILASQAPQNYSFSRWNVTPDGPNPNGPTLTFPSLDRSYIVQPEWVRKLPLPYGFNFWWYSIDGLKGTEVVKGSNSSPPPVSPVIIDCNNAVGSNFQWILQKHPLSDKYPELYVIQNNETPFYILYNPDITKNVSAPLLGDKDTTVSSYPLGSAWWITPTVDPKTWNIRQPRDINNPNLNMLTLHITQTVTNGNYVFGLEANTTTGGQGTAMTFNTTGTCK